MDQHLRLARLGRVQCAARASQHLVGEILPGMAIVQQTVRLLSDHVELDVRDGTCGHALREDGAQFAVQSGDGGIHGVWALERCVAQALACGLAFMARTEYAKTVEGSRVCMLHFHSQEGFACT